MSAVNLSNVIDDFTKLSLEDKEYVINILKKQYIEARRDYLSNRAKEVEKNLISGRIKKGSFNELYADLES